MQNLNEKIVFAPYHRKSSEQEDRQVLSIESQRIEMDILIKREKLKTIKEPFSESHSAKTRGQRPKFNQMVEMIEAGEANGILAWNVNRLSRNAGDTGIIIDLFDSGKLLEVRTPTQIFKNTPNDKFLLSLFCSQAKLENDNKSEDSKRGLKRKAEMGWYPCPAPLGYKNTPDKLKGMKTIETDKEKFPLVRKIFDMMLSGTHTTPAIWKMANEKWGLRNNYGSKIARSTVYRILTNPFYYGEFEYPQGSGNWRKGNHEPMITLDEFDRIQIILGRKGKPRPKTHEFAFTGMLKCGECGAAITAEEKTKRQKNGNVHQYTYYHCTKKKNPLCSQKCTEKAALEKQIAKTLKDLEIPSEFKGWALGFLKKQNEETMGNIKTEINKHQQSYNVCLRKIDMLIDMRASGEIDEEEFARKKKDITSEKERLKLLLDDSDKGVDDWIEQVERALTFAELARKRFETGTLSDKKEILAALGSNLILKDKELLITIQKPLLSIKEAALEVKQIHERLEPLEFALDERKLSEIYAQSPVLLRGEDSNL